MRIAQVVLLIVILVAIGYVLVTRTQIQLGTNGISLVNDTAQQVSPEDPQVRERTQPAPLQGTDNVPPADLKWTLVNPKEAVLAKKAILVNNRGVLLVGDEFVATAAANSSRVFDPAPVTHEKLVSEGWVKEIKNKTQTITPYVLTSETQKIDGYVKNFEGSVLAFIFSEETLNGQTTYRYFASNPTPMASLK
jgi:hypothetical protein